MTVARDIARRHRRILLAASAILWVGAMTATHIPGGRLPHVGVSDKFLHAVGYLALSAAFWLTLWAYGLRRRPRRAIVFLVMVAYAAVDEKTQPLVGRNAAFGDWLADVLGAAAALILLEAVIALRSRGTGRSGQSP